MEASGGKDGIVPHHTGSIPRLNCQTPAMHTRYA